MYFMFILVVNNFRMERHSDASKLENFERHFRFSFSWKQQSAKVTNLEGDEMSSIFLSFFKKVIQYSHSRLLFTLSFLSRAVSVLPRKEQVDCESSVVSGRGLDLKRVGLNVLVAEASESQVAVHRHWITTFLPRISNITGLQSIC